MVFVPLPIFSLGLKVQLEEWGFTPVEIAYSATQVIKSASDSPPSLLLMDGDAMKESDLMAIGQFLKQVQAEIPLIFFSKNPHKVLQGKQRTQWLDSYQWLPKPCHPEQLWQAVNRL